uniref:DNA repair protein REV1 n=1 Tax=Anopheles culicifacies TaxID=139723 RepID=A0A182MNF0_9DIPT
MKRKEKSETGFEGWGDYMDAKIAKLEDQFRHSSAVVGEKLSNLFAGVSIFVNGYTNPSSDELKRLMMLHGGVFHHYKRPTTTYTIASILPDVKVRSITSEIIISPRWVVDCLKEGKLLDYSKYLLYTQHKPSQPKLAFTKLAPLTNHVTDISKPVPKSDDDPNDISRSECLNVLGMLKHFTDPIPETSATKEQQEKSQQTLVEDTSNGIASCQAVAENGECPQPSTNGHGKESETSPLGSPDVFSEEDRPPAETSVQSSSAVKSPSKAAPSKQSLTATDPNFLKEFFNNSRLHHIATLGAGFKQYVSELREKSTNSFPARNALMQHFSTRARETTESEFSNDSNARYIMHIDMDCFFVSVGLRKYPHLRGLPVAVTHSRGSEARVPSHPGQNRALEIELYHKRLEERYQAPDIPFESRLSAIDEHNSLSEIASCSYEARQCGVKNGMFVGAALKLCPDLKTIPYDFEGYREVAHQLYDTIAQYTLDIEAVSCDEMFVDLTELIQSTGIDVMEFVTYVRDRISTATGCACSAGVGANRLQARMATKKAKPNGQYQLTTGTVEEYMRAIPIADLPGVGPSTSHRLKKMTYVTCADLQTIPKNVLQTEFGKKFGETLFNACRGIDEKPLVYDRGRKSVSVDVNYGIRFSTEQEVDRFMRQLTEEIHRRLLELRERGKLVTVKLLVRSPEAPIETAKFMGHGLCDVVTKSQPLRQHTDDLTLIEGAVLGLLRTLAIEPSELRGIGIQISKFEGVKRTVDNEAGNRLKSMFQKAEDKRKPPTAMVANACNEPKVVKTNEQLSSLYRQPDHQEPCTSRSCTIPQAVQSPVRQHLSTPTKAELNGVVNSPKRNDTAAYSPSRRNAVGSKPGTRGRRGRPPKWASLGGRKDQTQTTQSVGVMRKFLTSATSTSSANDLPEGLDPEVLAALPDDIREEAIRDYKRQQQQQLLAACNKPHIPPAEKTPVKMSPLREVDRGWKSPITPQPVSNAGEDQKIKIELKFLQALPPELRIEVEKQIELNKDNMVVTCTEPEIDEPLLVTPEQSPVRRQSPKKTLEPEEGTPKRLSAECKESKDPNILRRQNWRDLVEEWIDSTDEPYEYDVQLLAANGQELCESKSLERLYLFLRCLQRLVQEKNSCSWHLAYTNVVHPIQDRMIALCKTFIEEFYWYSVQVASNQEQLKNKLQKEDAERNHQKKGSRNSAEKNDSFVEDPLSSIVKLEVMIESSDTNEDSMTIDDAGNDNWTPDEEMENVRKPFSENEKLQPTQQVQGTLKNEEIVEDSTSVKIEYTKEPYEEPSAQLIPVVSKVDEIAEEPSYENTVHTTASSTQNNESSQSSTEQPSKLTAEQLVLQHHKLTCDLCTESLKDFADLHKHYKLVHKVTGYLRCCNRAIYKKCWMIEHLQLHLNPDAFRCEQCAKSYSSSKVLKEHLKEVHAPETERSFPCTSCGKAFVSRAHLNAHVMVAHGTVPCPQCKKVLSSQGSLRKHLVAVHGEGEKHVCEVCARVFRSKQCFDAHLKEHEGRRLEGKVQCELCMVWLTNKYCLTKHMRRKHAPPAEEEIVCGQCGKNAPNQEALKHHVRRVHGESRFECEWCHKKFKRLHHMKEHVAIHHTGEELYGCQHCSDRFNTKNKLYAHRKTVHPEEYAGELRKRMLME